MKASNNKIARYCTLLAASIIIIIIIMGLESVSASEDVIGDLPSP